MSLPDLTHESVLNAVREYDAVGREEFLRQYGFRPSRNYFLTWNGLQDCPRLNQKGAAVTEATPEAER